MKVSKLDRVENNLEVLSKIHQLLLNDDMYRISMLNCIPSFDSELNTVSFLTLEKKKEL